MSGGKDVSIRGHTIKFPYEPREEQKKFMNAVFESLDHGQNAYLESPTGTGKTISLLFTTLAWVKKEAEKRKIIYAVKSNTAKSEALKEFKKLSMEMRIENIKTISIAARDKNSCLHEEVKMKGEFISHHCKRMIKTGNCDHHFRNDEKKDYFQYFESDANGSQIVDIEDIANTIKPEPEHSKKNEQSKKCPYFVSREMIMTADIIFMPCDYLWDPFIGAYLENSILLLDDGHNFYDKCVEMESAEFKYDDLRNCINAFERQEWASLLQNTEAKNSIKKTLENMIAKINENQSPTNNVYEKVFNNTNVNEGNFQNIISGIKEILDIFIPKLDSSNKDYPLSTRLQGGNKVYCINVNEDYKIKIKALVVCLENLKKITRMMFEVEDFNTHKEKVEEYCHVYVKKDNMFYLHSFPAIAVSFLPKFHSIILASATLYGDPLNSVKKWEEMGINFHIQGQFEKNDQVCVEVFTHSPYGTELEGKFSNQIDDNYLRQLVETIILILSVRKRKSILFFPSHEFLETFSQQIVWTNWLHQTRRNSENIISITKEDSRDECNIKIKSFQAKDDAEDVIFMSELSGKIAEGLNIPNCTMIICGVPYPRLDASKVQFLKEKREDIWQQWYDFQACLRIEQAMGRVIRNENNRAAIILCDSRFGQWHTFNNYLPKLIRDNIRIETFDQKILNINNFFNQQTMSADNKYQKYQAYLVNVKPIHYILPRSYYMLPPYFRITNFLGLPSNHYFVFVTGMYMEFNDASDLTRLKEIVTYISQNSEYKFQVFNAGIQRYFIDNILHEYIRAFIVVESNNIYSIKDVLRSRFPQNFPEPQIVYSVPITCCNFQALVNLKKIIAGMPETSDCKLQVFSG